MLAKTWKKIGLIILIIACLWNIVGKLVHRISFDNAIEAAKAKMQSLKTQIQIKKNYIQLQFILINKILKYQLK